GPERPAPFSGNSVPPEPAGPGPARADPTPFSTTRLFPRGNGIPRAREKREKSDSTRVFPFRIARLHPAQVHLTLLERGDRGMTVSNPNGFTEDEYLEALAGRTVPGLTREKGLEGLMGLHRGRVLNLAARLVGATEAQDVVQEVFVLLFRKAALLRAPV